MAAIENHHLGTRTPRSLKCGSTMLSLGCSFLQATTSLGSGTHGRHAHRECCCACHRTGSRLPQERDFYESLFASYEQSGFSLIRARVRVIVYRSHMLLTFTRLHPHSQPPRTQFATPTHTMEISGQDEQQYQALVSQMYFIARAAKQQSKQQSRTEQRSIERAPSYYSLVL